VPYYYQDRNEQVQAIDRARHWLDRFAQLIQFEHVVLGTPARADDERRAAASGDSRQPRPR
jgi:hypothetical protein